MAYELYLDTSVILKMHKIKVMDKCIRDVSFFWYLSLHEENHQEFSFQILQTFSIIDVFRIPARNKHNPKHQGCQGSHV